MASVVQVVDVAGLVETVGDAKPVAIDFVRDGLARTIPLEGRGGAVEVSREVGGTVVKQGVDGGEGVDATCTHAVVLFAVACTHSSEFYNGVKLGGTQFGFDFEE